MVTKRKANITRKTEETYVIVSIDLDRISPVKVTTTIAFLDHMLSLLAHHGAFSLSVKASGDTEIDDHHLVEDVGITLGKAMAEALGSKKGISRYGNSLLPMDEALSYVAIDLSGRPYLDYDVTFKPQKSGFDFDLVQDFFYSFAINAGVTLHIKQKKGRNNHHIAESIFKGVGRALRSALAPDTKRKGVPSTKGSL